MLCLTITYPGCTYEVHLLNPGEHFARFGGSRHDLIVSGRKASLVLRSKTKMGTHDTEVDIHAPSVWNLLARCINDTSGELIATTPTLAEEDDANA